jgi:dihydrofolate reductase
MGKLVVDTFVTLDGVMQGPGGPDEDREGGFEYGGWQIPLFDDTSGQVISEQMAELDALLLGRKTYEIFASYWPHAADDDPIAATLNNVPKHVASRTLASAEWQNSSLIDGEVAAEVPALKDRYEAIRVIGSGDLVQTLMRHRLVDVYNVWVYPVLLGSGKRLFADGTIPTALRLISSTMTSTGAAILSYEPTGTPSYGTA